ncbi:MAG: glycoside hydrolase family 88 protein [Cyclobacteriaceae bacterium]|nr:glycoside hydrolase family 88 protein [Cyclobacteriaceae bacterium]
MLLSCDSKIAEHDRLLITVKRNYAVPKSAEPVTISIDWKELTTRLPRLKDFSFTVIDQNFGKEVSARLINTGNDKTPDYLVLDYTFNSNEPVFTFLIKPSGKRHEVVSEEIKTDERLEISFLTPLPVYEKQNGKLNNVASTLVESTMNIYPDVKTFPVYAPHRWNYEYSFFMAGAFKQGKKTGNQSFIDYSREWLDNFITEEGAFVPGVYKVDEYQLDNILPGRLVIYMHEETGLTKYKSIADTLIHYLANQPKTSDGGYWHKQVYPYQMWLDGIFMADVFSMQYAQAYNRPEWFDEAVHQVKLIYKHTLDPTTGLLYHGWDESKNPVWAHPEKGTSPEFWGRAVGWYAMALVECLEYLPETHPERKDVVEILQNLSSAVIKYQDEQSGLWYQVLDKGNQSGNWIETSCSAMFAYAFAKAHRQGFLDDAFLKAAEKAYNTLLNQYVYVDDAGNLHFDETVKIGTLNPKTSKGDYEYYITTEKRINDYKGLASLLYVSIELN